jgi:hypothetical protein
MKSLNAVATFTLAAALAMMAGCATHADDAHPMSAGWRVAHIDHEVSLDESTPLVAFSEDCRATLDGKAPRRWALLHFRRPPEDVFRVVPLQPGQAFKDEAEVYVNVNDCGDQLEQR